MFNITANLDIKKSYSGMDSYNDIKDSFLQDINESFNTLNNSSLVCIESYIDCMEAFDENIVEEGFNNFVQSIVSFLKELWNKFTNFFKKVFNYIRMQFMDFDKFLDENKGKIKDFTPFVETLYNYTIDASIIDISKLRTFIDDFNSNRKTIENISQGDFIKELGKFNDNWIEEVRGDILGIQKCSESEFKSELFKKYRNGETNKHMVEVDKNVLGTYINNYNVFKTILKDTQKIETKLRTSFDNIKSIFKSMPKIVYTKDGKQIEIKRINSYEHEVNVSHGETIDYTKERFIRLSSYYTKQEKVIKKLASIYITATVEKVSALVEALNTYKKIIKKGLSPFRGKIEEKIDKANEGAIEIETSSVFTETYSEITENMISSIQEDIVNMNIHTAYEQAYAMASVLENTSVIEADVQVVDRKESTSFVDSILKFFMHIVEAIKRIISRFVETGMSLFRDNEKWFNDNAYKFDNIPDSVYDRINIAIIPYWNAEGRLRESVSKVSKSATTNTIRVDERLNDEKEMYKWACPALYNIDKEDLQKAALLYYRGTNELVSVRGSGDVKNRVQAMIDYCRKYNDLVRLIKANTDKLLSEMDKAKVELEKELGDINKAKKIERDVANEEKKKTEEVEKHSTIVTKAGFSSVTEADNNDEVKNGTVGVTDDKGNTSTGANAHKNMKAAYKEASKQAKGYFTRKMMLYKIKQRILGAQLTVAEEAYNKYISVLKDVLNNGVKISDSSTAARTSSKEPKPVKAKEEPKNKSLTSRILGKVGNLFGKK